MGDIVVRILAGLCGAALFAVINQYVLTLSGPVWFATLAAMFVVAFGLAVLVQRTLADKKPPVTQTRASDNRSGGAMKIEVEGTPMAGATTSRDGAGNVSQGDMDIAIKNTK